MSRIEFNGASGDIPLGGVIVFSDDRGEALARLLVVGRSKQTSPSGWIEVVPATRWRVWWFKAKRWVHGLLR